MENDLKTVETCIAEIKLTLVEAEVLTLKNPRTDQTLKNASHLLDNAAYSLDEKGEALCISLHPAHNPNQDTNPMTRVYLTHVALINNGVKRTRAELTSAEKGKTSSAQLHIPVDEILKKHEARILQGGFTPAIAM